MAFSKIEYKMSVEKLNDDRAFIRKINLGGEFMDEDDQKRVMTPGNAFRSGADYIVVGRPIRNAEDPRKAALSIQAEIREVFEHR